MQFMVLSERDLDRFDEADFAPVIDDETQMVRELYARGVVRQIWLRDDTRGACFTIEAESLETARETVDALPLARKQMSAFQIIPLRPYGGFGPR